MRNSKRKTRVEVIKQTDENFAVRDLQSGQMRFFHTRKKEHKIKHYEPVPDKVEVTESCCKVS